MKLIRMVILTLLICSVAAPWTASAAGLDTGQDMLLFAAGGGNSGASENTGLTFTDISMIVMIILATIYFAALYVKEWRQVR
ncbi:hypothetical protein CathTA2_1121 [Caldalkalibacillus thermarum TA2.A1]|nr:hypothetical protein [Caldalkalibacillus thermarum]EGL83337.1 hypothetical protein CathTA2_1121 [Caldalkalibacillus thermarum TA2.A1]GGK14501.1 hypothetical protein GCM10010965_04460 [Caldalkalibacillus thermarum]